MRLFDSGLTILIVVAIGIFLQGGYAIGKAHPESANVVDALIFVSEHLPWWIDFI